MRAENHYICAWNIVNADEYFNVYDSNSKTSDKLTEIKLLDMDSGVLYFT